MHLLQEALNHEPKTPQTLNKDLCVWGFGVQSSNRLPRSGIPTKQEEHALKSKTVLNFETIKTLKPQAPDHLQPRDTC